MSVRYKLVLRKDLSKEAPSGAQKYYASVNNNGTLPYKQMCQSIAAYSTASPGDVHVVIDGLLFFMKDALLRGEIVQLGGNGYGERVQGGSYPQAPHRLSSERGAEGYPR